MSIFILVYCASVLFLIVGLIYNEIDIRRSYSILRVSDGLIFRQITAYVILIPIINTIYIIGILYLFIWDKFKDFR